MVRCPQLSDLSTVRFSEHDLLCGRAAGAEPGDEAGRVRVVVDGAGEELHFYGSDAPDGGLAPLVFLGGDCSQRQGGRWSAFDSYLTLSPHGMQLRAEQVARATGRTTILLARPGVYGSSGDHQQRRRPREVALVDAAITALGTAFGWGTVDLCGFSGGGHLVAALLGRRSDVGCAVIASGNVSVRQRNREQGWDTDITGFTDFVDPIDLVPEVARHPPGCLIVLTDPEDTVVSGACQAAYVGALRTAGVAVDHRLVSALDPGHHVLTEAALLAAAGAPTRTRSRA